MKALIIFALISVIGLAVLGTGPDSFINNVEAGGMFLLSTAKIDSAFIVKEIEKQITPNPETVEKGTFSLSEIIENSTKLLSVDTENMTKEKQAELEVHRLINLERIKHGLKTLEYDEKLASVAKSHSIDMASNEYFSHETPEGLAPTDRASRADYVCRYQIGNLIYSGIGENIHMIKGPSVALGSTPESIAELAVSGWMDSPGHKKNILTSNFSSEGIGVYISTFSIHVTQNFC